MQGNKYKNRKVFMDGIKFDSAKEARRYRELKLLEDAGEITDLRRQVRYELIPAQRIGGKLVERKVDYVADFTYIRTKDLKLIVEDVKDGYGDIERYYPMLLVKDFNSKGFRISDKFMTNADVPNIAFEGLISMPVNPFTGNKISDKYKNNKQFVLGSDKYRVHPNMQEYWPYAINKNIKSLSAACNDAFKTLDIEREMAD